MRYEFQKKIARIRQKVGQSKPFYVNIDLASLGYKDRDQTTKRKRKFHLDLALTCTLKDQNAEIYLVFEHKSAPEKITLVQILTYWDGVQK